MKIELKPATVETLKEINEKVTEISNNLKTHYQEYLMQLRALNAQKSIILGTIIKEKELDTEKRYILNEDYSLEELSEERFEELSKQAENIVLDVPNQN